MTIDEKINALAESTQANAQQLQTLLTRDPRKEFGYGPQFDPNVTRRFQSNLWRSANPLAGSTAPIILCAPNSVEEISLCFADSGDTRPVVLVRVEMDNNDKFTNIPADNRDSTIFLAPSAVSLNAFNPATGIFTSYNYYWEKRFPCVLKWLRLTMVAANGAAITWSASKLSIGFHGQ